MMEENLRMAREIQLTMLPQQYPMFPKDAPPTKARSNSLIGISPPRR